MIGPVCVSVAQLMRQIVPTRSLPPLVTRSAWDRLQALATPLPAALIQAFYFECRLASHAERVDWIVRVERHGADIVAGRNARLALPPSCERDLVWSRLRRLAVWCRDDDLLRHVISHGWLEFDVESASGWDRVPHPSVFLAFNRERTTEISPAAWEDILDRVWACLQLGRPRLRAAVLRIIRERPACSAIPYLGLMLGRPGELFRVYLVRNSIASLPTTLARIGWSGNARELMDRLRIAEGAPRLAPAAGMLHIDVEDEVLPRLGIEYQLGGGHVGFLRHLVDVGLCAESKYAALAAWPDASRQFLSHELWESTVRRCVNHVKLLYEPNQALAAKGYLLTQWMPVDGRAATARGISGPTTGSAHARVVPRAAAAAPEGGRETVAD